ncbi:MAG: glycosytransferase [bacterium]
MTQSGFPRVLWLINHMTARAFEIELLKRSGFREIFQPKRYPNHHGARSGSVDYSEDTHLTIPPDDLKFFNETDWYASCGKELWDKANRYFDVLVSNFAQTEMIDGILRHFKGAILYRAYGTQNNMNYSSVLTDGVGNRRIPQILSLKDRFWFAQAYEGLHLNEEDFLKKRTLYLPLGLRDCDLRENWTGEENKIFIVCPDIGCNEYYRNAYHRFQKDFLGFDFAVGGSQSVRVRDPRILGFLPREAHEENMRRMRVMFYPSQEARHVHYHPFEAVRSGMPLVFMAGGLLDQLGGKGLPGRCAGLSEARKKLRRVLNGDWPFIKKIRETQVRLLEPMKPENCESKWAEGFQRVLEGLRSSRSNAVSPAKRTIRVAVLLPVGYRGGSLVGAKLLARAIQDGAKEAGSDVEVVLGHLDDPGIYDEEDFTDLPPAIKTRPYHWRTVHREEAERALAFHGVSPPWRFDAYQVPEDGIQQFMDCDLWLVVSNRLELPLLPIHDYNLMLYDCLERYQNLWSEEMTARFLLALHGARKVFVTSEFTRRDALQFAGLAESKVVKLPMLPPTLSVVVPDAGRPQPESPYFLWTTNLSPQKNQERAFQALRLYYEKYDGRLDCHVCGVGTDDLLTSLQPHLARLPRIWGSSAKLKTRLKLRGEIPESQYQASLADSAFLWHAGLIDNGTYSVVEAAFHGVPALTSDYPAMREIESLAGLPMSWMDPYDPNQMAFQLKAMERDAQLLRRGLPAPAPLLASLSKNMAGDYWKALEDGL